MRTMPPVVRVEEDWAKNKAVRNKVEGNSLQVPMEAIFSMARMQDKGTWNNAVHGKGDNISMIHRSGLSNLLTVKVSLTTV